MQNCEEIVKQSENLYTTKEVGGALKSVQKVNNLTNQVTETIDNVK